MTWETLKIILGILFLVVLFILLPMLMRLAYIKKTFLIYADQIRNTGKVENEISFLKIQFDFLIAGYIFSDIPSYSQQPDIYKIKRMTGLKEEIDILTKIAKPLGLAFGLLVVTLITLLNIFEK